MMGKIVKSGKSFKGCVAYCMLKNEAEVLYAEGVRADDIRQTIEDFNMQRKLNADLGQAVGHIALNFSPEDALKLTDEKMLAIAHEYLEKMKIGNTQMLIVKHNDTRHPHLHIVYNRVNNQAKTIKDSMQRWDNVKVSKALTLKHSLHLSQGKQQVNRLRLKGPDQAKYQLYDAIRAVSQKVRSVDELQQQLKKQGIGMQYKYKSGTREVQGISFSKGQYKFKGSEIDRSLSYCRLSAAISHRIAQEQQQQVKPSLAQQLRQRIQENDRQRAQALSYGKGNGHSLLGTLLEQSYFGGQAPQDDSQFYRRKKKKGQQVSR
ncbi:MAG: mobilization protein [Mucilaginibacter sp.]|nr:mobilization protein [Mucilaginibacter sp.]